MIEFAALIDRLCKSAHDDMEKVALVFGYSISCCGAFNRQESLLVIGFVSEGIFTVS